MIVTMQDLPRLRQKHKKQKIVLAGGVFDLLHLGHLELFKQMKKFGDIVVITVSSDTRVRQRKGPNRPIHDQKTRIQIVDAIKNVDYALPAPTPPSRDRGLTTLRLMPALRPDIFVTSEKQVIKRHYGEIIAMGVKPILIPRYSKYVSTTRTIKKVLDRHTAI